MDEVFRDLWACVNCLGSYEDNNFVRNADTAVSLRDIHRYLHNESQQCEIRLELGRLNMIKHYIFPLIKNYKNDSSLFVYAIRTLMNLTTPAHICFRHEVPTDVTLFSVYRKVDELLKSYKLIFADEDLLKILACKVMDVFNKDWEDRSEDDHKMVERIMIIIRNVLHINTSEKDSEESIGSFSQHDRVVEGLFNSGWNEILIYLSNTEDEHRFTFHTLEIVSLMFREQTGQSMIFDNSAKKDEIQNRMLFRQKEIDRTERFQYNSRAVRFGGTYELKNVKTATGLPLIYHHDVMFNKINLEQDRKLRKVPKNRLPNRQEVNAYKSPIDILKRFHNFCKEFLKHGFNYLMTTAFRRAVRDEVHSDDETYLLWAVEFFGSVCRLNKMSPELVCNIISVEMFQWVYKKAISLYENGSTEKALRRLLFIKLEYAMGAYKELLEFLLWMDLHKDEKYQKLSTSIKGSVFYQEEYLDIYPMLLSKYNQVTQSRSYLRKLVEGNYLMMKILQNHRSFNMSVVRKLKRIRRKQQGRKNRAEPSAPVMPSDNYEELLLIWAEILPDLERFIKNEIQLPAQSDLPILFDPFVQDELEPIQFSPEPIQPDSEMINKQLKRALSLVQIRLRLKKPSEAVAILNSAQSLWPDEGIIDISESDKPLEEQLSILKKVLLAPKFYNDDDLQPLMNVPQTNDDEEEEEEEGVEEFETETIDYDDYVGEEVMFDLMKYLIKFTHPNIIKAYSLLFADYLTNSTKTNDRLLNVMHRIAVKMHRPSIFYSLRLFNAILKLFEDPVSKLDEFKGLAKFSKYLIIKFTEDVAKNPKLLMEILFQRSPIESLEMVEGYKRYDDSDNEEQMWTEERDAELIRAFEEAKSEGLLPGTNLITMIECKLMHSKKTRRDISNRLVHLGLVESVKELKIKQKKFDDTWTEAEISKLSALVDEYRDENNPIRCIVRYLQENVPDKTRLKPKRLIVKKILELNLVSDESELGIKKRITVKRAAKFEGEESSASDENDDNDHTVVENSRVPDENEDFISQIFRELDFGNDISVRRTEPVMRVKRMVDWMALKINYAKLPEHERQWIIDRFDDLIESRNSLSPPYIHLSESDSEILSNSKLIKHIFGVCNFIPPDVDMQETDWRIPDDMTSKEIWYMKNCVSSLTDNDLFALVNDVPDSSSAKSQNKRQIKRLAPPAQNRSNPRKMQIELQSDNESSKSSSESSDDEDVMSKFAKLRAFAQRKNEKNLTEDKNESDKENSREMDRSVDNSSKGNSPEGVGSSSENKRRKSFKNALNSDDDDYDVDDDDDDDFGRPTKRLRVLDDESD